MEKVLFEKRVALYAFLLSVVFLFSVGLVFAQDEPTPQERREAAAEKRVEQQDSREVRQANIEERRTEQQVSREERQAERLERTKERTQARVDKMVTRFNAALERLTRLADRMESRIEKLEAREFDLGVARGLLTDARAALVSAQADVDAVGAAAEEALEGDNPKEAFSAVRELLGDAKTSIKEAHRALVEAIREIKAGISVRPDATSGNGNGEGEEEEEENEEGENGGEEQ